MKNIYKLETGLTRVKTNTKKYVAAIASSVAIAGFAVVPAMAATPVISGSASGKACFGQWRAATADGSAFAERKSANSTNNVLDKAYCASQLAE